MRRLQKPFLKKYRDNHWEFIHPSSIENETVRNQYLEGLECLDYDDEEAELIFKRLIAKHRYHLDAYNHLSIAFRNQGKTFESLLTAEKAYKLGKDCIPGEFQPGIDLLVWSVFENRPFLRSCQIYGLELQYHKDYESAANIYKENLLLNPGDNQGIRYLLLEVYFTSKNYKQARLLLEEHSDDWSIDFKFGLVTLNVLEGNIKEADKILPEAIETNEFFIDEVIKDKHIQPPAFKFSNGSGSDDMMPLGSVQLAFDYWERNKALYKDKKVIEYYKACKAKLK